MDVFGEGIVAAARSVSVLGGGFLAEIWVSGHGVLTLSEFVWIARQLSAS